MKYGTLRWKYIGEGKFVHRRKPWEIEVYHGKEEEEPGYFMQITAKGNNISRIKMKVLITPVLKYFKKVNLLEEEAEKHVESMK